jgi:uncharacterized protein (DUF1015 family)
MATIKPFRAIQPNPFYADKLVFPGDEQVFFFGINAKEYPLLPLKEQLESPARQKPETEEGQQQAYKQIMGNLESLLEMGRLWKDERPGIYIYEIVHRNYRQTGVWALTSIKDFVEGRIKIHELTLADSERRIANYRKNTGLEGSPVLLTYEPTVEINRIIAETCANNKKTTIGNKKSLHRIWKIEDETKLDHLITAFSKVTSIYMADGHHRLAGTAKLAKEKLGSEFISSLFIASDQLRILDYHRVILPAEEIHENILLDKLGKAFSIFPSTKPVKPESPHVIGMCLKGRWYELVSIDKTKLDTVLLQEDVLATIFNIVDPRTDGRLKCIGGENALDETIEFIRLNPASIAFTLYPLSVNGLIKAADSATILPPKSTWIDPKVPYGLLLVQHKVPTNDKLKQHYE